MAYPPHAVGMRTGAPCARCHRPVRQRYMLHDRVWFKAVKVGGFKGLSGSPWIGINLHIGCVEKLLGRRLRTQDFYFQDFVTKVRR
jgi:hypothetical protein